MLARSLGGTIPRYGVPLPRFHFFSDSFHWGFPLRAAGGPVALDLRSQGRCGGWSGRGEDRAAGRSGLRAGNFLDLGPCDACLFVCDDECHAHASFWDTFQSPAAPPLRPGDHPPQSSFPLLAGLLSRPPTPLCNCLVVDPCTCPVLRTLAPDTTARSSSSLVLSGRGPVCAGPWHDTGRGDVPGLQHDFGPGSIHGLRRHDNPLTPVIAPPFLPCECLYSWQRALMHRGCIASLVPPFWMLVAACLGRWWGGGASRAGGCTVTRHQVRAGLSPDTGMMGGGGRRLCS